MDGKRRTLAGRYELVEVIGRVDGTVYRGVDLVLGRSVAVKILPGALADQDPTMRRAVRARSARRRRTQPRRRCRDLRHRRR